MTDTTAARPDMPRAFYRRLYLPAYTTSEAAHLAGTNVQTVTRWCLGYTARGSRRPAVIREKRPWKPLSYLELVEVAFVATCRRLNMSLQEIRSSHDYMSKMINQEYPFASSKLIVNGLEILKEWEQQELELNPMIVTTNAGQMMWSQLMRVRIDQFTWEYDIAMPWFPRGKDARIIVDPRISFGAPTVYPSGISTWTFRERFNAGETIDELIEDFEVDKSAILAALEFEGIKIAA